jgi:hypothetical protein
MDGMKYDRQHLKYEDGTSNAKYLLVPSYVMKERRGEWR